MTFGRDRTCGGSGYLHCYCGGDFCMCANQGEIECMGCSDCDSEWWDEDDEDFERPWPPIDTTAPRGAEETNEHE